MDKKFIGKSNRQPEDFQNQIQWTMEREPIAVLDESKYAPQFHVKQNKF